MASAPGGARGWSRPRGHRYSAPRRASQVGERVNSRRGYWYHTVPHPDVSVVPIVYLELDGQGARYAQLIRALKGAILDGRVNAGARLPASRSLARELDLSRNTVLAAYEQLQAEGFL